MSSVEQIATKIEEVAELLSLQSDHPKRDRADILRDVMVEAGRELMEHAAALREQPEARGVVDAPIEGPRLPSGGSIESKAKAWDEVVNVMDEVCPDWVRRSKVGAWAVCAAIREMAAAQQPVQEGGVAALTNPWTGEPRDYRDVNSDPAGTLCVEPGAPLKAAPPSAPVGVDGCNESNCPRCLTHPDHSGDMAHAGIGGYPTQQPAQAAPGCTCPSGDGSLRWPCPTHPPGDDAAGGKKHEGPCWRNSHADCGC